MHGPLVDTTRCRSVRGCGRPVEPPRWAAGHPPHLKLDDRL